MPMWEACRACGADTWGTGIHADDRRAHESQRLATDRQSLREIAGEHETVKFCLRLISAR